jgi:hypothetical protein
MFVTLGLAGSLRYGDWRVMACAVTWSGAIGEFNLRLATRVSPADVLSLVVRGSLATTTAGLSIGLGLAMLLGWGLRAAIYQISPLDPGTLGAGTAILALSSLAASIIRARRAANVLPMTAQN